MDMPYMTPCSRKTCQIAVVSASRTIETEPRMVPTMRIRRGPMRLPSAEQSPIHWEADALVENADDGSEEEQGADLDATDKLPRG
jgi:hypothetical protein